MFFLKSVVIGFESVKSLQKFPVVIIVIINM